MDTYKRSIRGLQSRSNGEHFEGMIIAASRFYEERGIAAVDKTPEAFKVLKAMDRNRGQFICCFTKQAQPDFKGILMDSTMILFDAKHTDKDKIGRDVVTAEQQACFERYMKLGAMAYRTDVRKKRRRKARGKAMKCSISTYYKILDAELYNYDDGYMQLNVDIDTKNIDLEEYVSMQKKSIADMCNVPEEKVIPISRLEYETYTDE